MKVKTGILITLILVVLCTVALADVEINKKNFPDERKPIQSPSSRTPM